MNAQQTLPGERSDAIRWAVRVGVVGPIMSIIGFSVFIVGLFSLLGGDDGTTALIPTIVGFVIGVVVPAAAAVALLVLSARHRALTLGVGIGAACSVLASAVVGMPVGSHLFRVAAPETFQTLEAVQQPLLPHEQVTKQDQFADMDTIVIDLVDWAPEDLWGQRTPDMRQLLRESHRRTERCTLSNSAVGTSAIKIVPIRTGPESADVIDRLRVLAEEAGHDLSEPDIDDDVFLPGEPGVTIRARFGYVYISPESIDGGSKAIDFILSTECARA